MVSFTVNKSLGLTSGAKRVCEFVRNTFIGDEAWDCLGINHWLLGLIELYGSLLEEFVEGLEVLDFRHELIRQLEDNIIGPPLPEKELLQKASQTARCRGKTRVTRRELVVSVLNLAAEAGYILHGETNNSEDDDKDEDFLKYEELERKFDELFNNDDNLDEQSDYNDKYLLIKYGRNKHLHILIHLSLQ